MAKPEKKYEEAVEIDPLYSHRESMGMSPAVLAKRHLVRKLWCPKLNIEFDPWCDEDNPKQIKEKHINKAATIIESTISKSPLMKSQDIRRPLEVDLYFKVETFHITGSFFERAAVNVLTLLSTEQKYNGVITASLGNWAMALAYHGKRLQINVTVVMPVNTPTSAREKCSEYDATVILRGHTLSEAKYHAFELLSKGHPPQPIYISGYDHPHVIAAAGTIGKEIMEELPETDVILVPVGGGGLIAGVAVAAKEIKPAVQIYGVELKNSTPMNEALRLEHPVKVEADSEVAYGLAAEIVGYNAFYTLRPLIDKMVIVGHDLVAAAVTHLVEEERIIVEGAGATSLAPLMANPPILSEIKGKKVVCIATGGNVDYAMLPRYMERARTIEGRLMQLEVTLPVKKKKMFVHLLSMIRNVGGNIIHFDAYHNWYEERDMFKSRYKLTIETFTRDRLCSLRRVLEKLFPNCCVFEEEPFKSHIVCICHPRIRNINV